MQRKYEPVYADVGVGGVGGDCLFVCVCVCVCVVCGNLSAYLK